ncbi:MAG: hypothetical protein Q7R85_00165 [bacterium]|nr:hypothetical protein [bacterium]
MRRWIEDIRNSDEATKQRWVIGFTVATSSIVVALWMGYVALQVPDITQPKARLLANAGIAARTITAPPKTAGVTETFTAGAGAIADGIGLRLSRGIAMVKGILGPSNTIEVRGVKQDFILKGVEAVPETEFP